MAVLTDFLTGIANKLRSNLGTTGTINASQFSTKIDEVYSKSTSDWWKKITNNGTRTNYNRFFTQIDLSGQAIPAGLVKPGMCFQTFYNYLGTSLPTGIDLSGITTTDDANLSGTFAWAYNLKVIPDMGLPALAYYDSTFTECSDLETIEKIRVSNNTIFGPGATFYHCSKLKNITIEGTICKSGLLLQYCPLLTGQSIDSIFAAMDTSTPGTQKTITFATAHKATANAYHNNSAFWDNRATLYTSYGWSISLM